MTDIFGMDKILLKLFEKSGKDDKKKLQRLNVVKANK
jgi:hypothetical protein